MYPVLVSINGFSLTTITVFLYGAFFLALFVIWRLSRFYEIDSEKTLDMFLMTSLIGLIFARVEYVLVHLDTLGTLSKAVNIFKYPGYSFWGGFIAGIIYLWFINRKYRSGFWVVGDIAIVGLFLGISITSLGCLFSVCQYGQPSSLPFAVTQIGLIGKRFPLQIVESAFFLIGFFYLWKKIVKYHPHGTIITRGLMIFGLIKFFLEFFRGDIINIPYFDIGLGAVFGITFFIFGVVYFYDTSKRSFKSDLMYIKNVIFNKTKRRNFFIRVNRNWSNFVINSRLALKNKRKKLTKSLHVKSNPSQF